MGQLKYVNESELVLCEPPHALSPIYGMEILEEINNLRTWNDFVTLCDKYGDWLCYELSLTRRWARSLCLQDMA